MRNYYSYLVSKHDNWALEDLFQDDRNSTFGFNTMIRNAKRGKYDIIITPSFLRFHSTPVIASSAIKELKALEPPTGIYFDIEDFFTLEDQADARVNSLLLFAEQKREQKKSIIRWSSRVKEHDEPTIVKKRLETKELIMSDANTPFSDSLFSVKETAKYLGISKNKVYDLIHSGLLPAIKIGGLKIRSTTLRNFLATYEGYDITDPENIRKIG